MPSGYQIFKNEIFQTVKTTYFTDYNLKEGENILTLVTSKCKDEWQSLSEIQKKIYNDKASSTKKETKQKDEVVENKDTPPSYEESESVPKDLSSKKETKNKKKRKNIPKAVKESVWKKYISETALEGKCFIGCGNDIQINNFEIGHVVAFANGGKDTIDNLRPICSLCNKSMGTTNINEFISTFGFKENNDYDDKIKSNEKNIAKLNKSLAKNEKTLNTKIEKQSKLKQDLENMNTTMQELLVKINMKEKEIESNTTKISELETAISKDKEEKAQLEKSNNEITQMKQSLMKAKMIEEEKLKEELRKEILLEQKKNALKLQMMKEMGITN